jgi:hypothetical protein
MYKAKGKREHRMHAAHHNSDLTGLVASARPSAKSGNRLGAALMAALALAALALAALALAAE